MIASLINKLRRLPSAFATAAQLLAPRSAACLLCGKPYDESRSAAAYNQSKLTTQLRQSLCGACLSAIPWLTRIACTRCGRGIACEDCVRSPKRAFVCNRSAVRYNPVMRAMLALYKYRGNERLAPLLGVMLLPAFESMTEEIAAKHKNPRSGPSKSKVTFANYWDAITFVPISTERSMERGFNQAEQLASHIAEKYRLPLMNLLTRSRHSEKQSFKTRAERMSDTKALFSVNYSVFNSLNTNSNFHIRKSQSPNKLIRILLVDDIYTTGSTAEACAQVLHQHAQLPLEIYVLTWARS